jgi:hypothetical protein
MFNVWPDSNNKKDVPSDDNEMMLARSILLARVFELQEVTQQGRGPTWSR